MKGMTTFTVSIPKELKKKMDSMSHINWPEYLIQRFEVRVKEFKRFEELRRSGGLFK